MSGRSTDPLENMAPWDAVPYFQGITQGSVTLPAAGFVQLVPADPMRIALVVDTGAQAVTLGLTAKASTSVGIQVSTSRPLLVMRFAETGPLCQQQWFVTAPQNTVVTFYAIALSRWPSATDHLRRRKNVGAPASPE
jgi:hypothetical protein